MVGVLSVVALQVGSVSPAWETRPGHHLQNCNFSHFLPWQPRTAAAWPWLWSTKYIAAEDLDAGEWCLVGWSGRGRHHIAASDYDAGDFNLQLIFSKLQSSAAHKKPADNCWSWLASIRPYSAISRQTSAHFLWVTGWPGLAGAGSGVMNIVSQEIQPGKYSHTLTTAVLCSAVWDTYDSWWPPLDRSPQWPHW